MEALRAFATTVLHEEYQLLVTQNTERNDAVYAERCRHMQRLWSFDIGAAFARPTNQDDDFFERGRIRVENSLAERTLFQLKQYSHPVIGELYRLYASYNRHTSPNRSAYYTNYYITRRDNELSIIAWYNIKNIPKPGIELTVGNLTWMWYAGEQLKTLGDLVAVHKVQPPDDPDHRAEYEAE